MTPVEHASRVLCRIAKENADEIVMFVDGVERPRWHDKAVHVQAVINIMREPSSAMLEAADRLGCSVDTKATWQAMIDVALAELMEATGFTDDA